MPSQPIPRLATISELTNDTEGQLALNTNQSTPIQSAAESTANALIQAHDQAANAFKPALGSPEHSEDIIDDRSDKDTPKPLANFGITPNTIAGQSRGQLPTQRLIELSNVEIFKKFTITLDTAPSSLQLHSVLPSEQRKYIGLLRAPSLNESEIENFDYNLSMAETVLTLGANVRHLLLKGERLTLNPLWSDCCKWRVGQLDEESESEEISDFASQRCPPHAEPTMYVTIFSNTSNRYSYLIDRMAETTREGSCNFVDDNKDAVIGWLKTPFIYKGQNVNAVEIMHLCEINGKQLILTTLRAVLDANDQAIPHSWTHESNQDIEIFDPKLEPIEPEQQRQAVMIHCDNVVVANLHAEISLKLEHYQTLITKTLNGLPLKQALQIPDFTNKDVIQIVKALGDLHFLLAQATIDFRGSAAKSELFIRSLAASAGLELPPFKRGFVPDLEAFTLLRSHFVDIYPKSFEQA